MRGPSTCPTCGHDPAGDDDTFQSGGGWVFSNSVADGIFREELYCPVCDELVWSEEKTMGRDGRA